MQVENEYGSYDDDMIVVLQYSSGGPIIAVQVENEYGSYGDDMQYKIRLAEVFAFVQNYYLCQQGGGNVIICHSVIL